MQGPAIAAEQYYQDDCKDGGFHAAAPKSSMENSRNIHAWVCSGFFKAFSNSHPRTDMALNKNSIEILEVFSI